MNNLRVLGMPINTPVVIKSSAAAAAALANAVALAFQANAQPGNAALQVEAQNAAVAAQSLLAAAIQDAQQAYDQAVKEGGATQPQPGAADLPSAPTGATSDPGVTPAGSGGSGGGGTACGASCS